MTEKTKDCELLTITPLKSIKLTTVKPKTIPTSLIDSNTVGIEPNSLVPFKRKLFKKTED